MRDNKVIQVLALAVTVGAAAAMVLTLRGGWGPALNPDPPRAVGAELARQALSLLKPGGQITLLTRDTATFPNPATDLVRDGFQRALRRAHVGVGGEEKLEVDPLRRVLVPSGDFQGWIHHGNSGDVIVSLMGPPVLSPSERAQLGEIKPAVVAFCPGNWPEQVDFRSLFGDGLLSAAVVSRPGVAASRKFAEGYVTITKANVDDFVASAGRNSAPTAP